MSRVSALVRFSSQFARGTRGVGRSTAPKDATTIGEVVNASTQATANPEVIALAKEMGSKASYMQVLGIGGAFTGLIGAGVAYAHNGTNKRIDDSKQETSKRIDDSKQETSKQIDDFRQEVREDTREIRNILLHQASVPVKLEKENPTPDTVFKLKK